MGSERNIAVVARLKELTASQATFESKIGEMLVFFNTEVMPRWGILGAVVPEFAERSVWPRPSWDDLNETLDPVVKCAKLCEEAAALTEDPILRQYITLCNFFSAGMFAIMSENEKWSAIVPGEAALVEAVNAYEYHTHGPVHKSVGNKYDYFRACAWINVPGLHYGALDVVQTWCEKATGAWLERGIAKSHNYGDDTEIQWLLNGAIPVLLLLGERTKTASLLAAAGFGWDDVAFDAWWPAYDEMFGALGTAPKAPFHAIIKLEIFLASPDGALDPAEVMAWLPSPTELGELDKPWMVSTFALCNVTAFGARAYERLGEDEKAAETARLGVAQHKKKIVVADCHCVLGRVAARGGDAESAEAHFRSAMNEARTARAYVFEIIAAREWKRHVLDAAGRAAEADAVIDAACGRMGKDRATLESLLA